MSMYQQLIANNPEKYPSRMGKKWEESEVHTLLGCIQDNKTHEEIAQAHSRTMGGIRSKLRDIAATSYFDHTMTIESIQGLTGLTEEEIKDSIAKRVYIREQKQQKVATKPVTLARPLPTRDDYSMEVDALRKDVQILKKDVAEILRLMNALYDFETA